MMPTEWGNVVWWEMKNNRIWSQTEPKITFVGLRTRKYLLDFPARHHLNCQFYSIRYCCDNGSVIEINGDVRSEMFQQLMLLLRTRMEEFSFQQYALFYLDIKIKKWNRFSSHSSDFIWTSSIIYSQIFPAKPARIMWMQNMNSWVWKIKLYHVQNVTNHFNRLLRI